MSVKDLLASDEFRGLPEESQIDRLRTESNPFRSLHESDPERALTELRKLTGKDANSLSTTGTVIRQFSSGVGESFTDVAQLPFEAAEWVASKAGSEWRSGADQAIEEFAAKQFPEPTTKAGRIARSTGYGVGTGIQIFGTGGAAAATKLPVIAKAGRFLASKGVLGLGVETGAGAAGGAAAGATAEVTDNPIYIIGASILAGGAAGVGIAARGAVKRSKSAAARETQPPTSTVEGGSPSPSRRTRKLSPVDEVAEARHESRSGREAIFEAEEKSLEEARKAAIAREGGTAEMLDPDTARLPETGGPFRVPNETPSQTASRDAWENLTTDEQKAMMAGGAEGGPPKPKIEELDAAAEFDARETLTNMLEGVHQTMTPATVKSITRAGGSVLESLGIPRDPFRTMKAQVEDVIRQGKMSMPEVDELMRANGLSYDELGKAYLMSGRSAAQTMQVLSAQARRLNKVTKARELELGRKLTQEELAQEATALGGHSNSEGMGWWQRWAGVGVSKRMENVRRGMIVSALATAMRNVETQVGNLTLHALEDSLEGAILKLWPEAVQKAHPTNALGALSRIFRYKKTKGTVDEIDKFFKGQEDDVIDPLYSHYVSDIESLPAGATGTPQKPVFEKGVVGGLERAAHILNTGNRFQEWAIRRAVFTEDLARRMELKGLSLDDLVEKGRIGQIPRKEIEGAIETALDRTWGRGFEADSPIKGERIAAKVISAINETSIGPFHMTQLIPFPRFMANSIRWQYQHSPHHLVTQFMSPAGRAAFRNGDIKPLVKATTGLGMLLSAHQLRSSQEQVGVDVYGEPYTLAGEKWYEIRPPQAVAEAFGFEPGTTFDTRAYNPFASFLFAADVIHRWDTDTMNSFTTKDVAMGFLATNVRAGAGLYVLDQFLDRVSETISTEDPETKAESFRRLGKAGAEYLGAAWSGILQPMTQIRDIFAQFDESQQTLRDQGAEALSGPFKAKVPYAGENLPEVELATREAPPKSIAPLARQLAGVTARSPKNPAERELDRMGFTKSNLVPSSGNDDWDRLVSKHMGPLMESQIVPILQSPAYKGATPEAKEVFMEAQLKKIRAVAKKQAAIESPELFQEYREKRRGSKRQQNFRNRTMRRAVEARKVRLEERRVGS
jgi:hypothetical protein